VTDQTNFIYSATGENFDRLVLENSRKGLVLVDFWSPRAGPSLRQREMLTRLANAMGGRFLLVAVNTDEEKQLVREYGVRSLPSLKLFRHGRVVEEVRGVQPEADYRRIVERHLAGSGDRVQAAALAAWQAGQQDKAIGILAEGAMAQPENAALPLLMAKLLMRQDRHSDAHAVLEALPAPASEDAEVVQLLAHLDFIVTASGAPAREALDERLARQPDDAEARYQLASQLLVQDDFAGAMEHLMVIQRRQPAFRGGVARRGLLALFRMLDAGDERVKRFRAELFNLSH
jgi:putative thioredoxin